MKDWLLEHKFYMVVALFIGLSGFYYFSFIQTDPVPTEAISMASTLKEEGQENTKNNQPEQKEKIDKIMVDVKGQIKQPGVYQVSTGDRVIDVISRAGGLTEQADQAQVNFAAHVVDEMVVYVPAKGEETAAVVAGSIDGSSTGIASTSDGQAKININKADENELQNLPGIGPAKAVAILEYRNTNGPFKVVDDLKNISGIGDKTFEKLKDLIVVH
ncbi:helix-hairpin-helix domain-containing protein [Bacillus sp. 1P10SD]|uniref:helix-hairpin-helix domain-containing protein n=1 Tax=Bacillus sp. 1P10SD TaxID=3132265 RepID=UPI0039A4C3A2